MYCLAGLVVRHPPQEWKIPGSNPACNRIFMESSHTSDLKIGSPVANLPGTWCYRVSTGTGRPGVSILGLGEMESLVCSFCLSVAANKIEQIRPWDTLACCWDVKQPTNKQTSLYMLKLALHRQELFVSGHPHERKWEGSWQRQRRQIWDSTMHVRWMTRVAAQQDWSTMCSSNENNQIFEVSVLYMERHYFVTDW